MNPYEVIRRPIITEKSNLLRDSQLKYIFEIDMRASKHDLRRALKKIYDVDAVTINTLVTRGKLPRRGAFLGRTISKTKKAYVALKPGQVLKMFSAE